MFLWSINYFLHSLYILLFIRLMAYPTMEEALNGEGTENGNSADNSTNINNNGTVDATSAEASDNTGYAAENTEEGMLT